VDSLERFPPTFSCYSKTTRGVKEPQTCLNNHQMIILFCHMMVADHNGPGGI
jgi:hypothetical protein